MFAGQINWEIGGCNTVGKVLKKPVVSKNSITLGFTDFPAILCPRVRVDTAHHFPAVTSGTFARR
jgi:hypothetical protein